MADDIAAPRQVCVAPLSSPFSTLPRAHTYALVAALILPLPQGWLFRAALAAFTTRTAIFAIDAAVVLHKISSMAPYMAQPAPLDAVVLLEMLGLAVMVACWLLLASTKVRESSARPLIRLWAFVVTISATMAFISMARLGRMVAARDMGIQVVYDECEGMWMDESNVFGAVEIVSVLGPTGWKFVWLERRIGIPSLILSAVALLGTFLPTKRPAALHHISTEHTMDDLITDKPGASWSQSATIQRLVKVTLRLALPAAAIFVIVSTEQYLLVLTSDLPSIEQMSSVGQWGVWAATGAVLLATLMNSVRDKLGLLDQRTNLAETTETGPVTHMA